MAGTVFDLLRKAATGSLGDEHGTFSFRKLDSRAGARAADLAAKGVKRGDRVMIAQRNSVDWIVSALGVMRLGAIAVPINPDSTAREAAVYEGIVDPRLVLLDERVENGNRFKAPTTAPGFSEAGSLPPPPGPEDRALIFFTSGTTGFPKGVVQLHRTLVRSGEGMAHWIGLTPADRLLMTMPLFHANAIYYSLMGGIAAGASLTVLPRFSVSGFWGSVREARATEVNLMGPMIAMLLSQPERPDDRDNSLRLVYTAAVRPKVMEEFSRRFDVEIVEGYGMTETPYGCITPRAAPKPGSIGLPRQHPTGAVTNEIRIADSEGRSLPDGETGEILIRNDAMCLEYWNNPEATAAAFRDGWLRTGDLGYRDAEGYFHIVGRAKEIVRRKGVNIAPAEIEIVLLEMSEVGEAALVGVPSSLGEEDAVAVVTLAPGAQRKGAEDRILAAIAGLVSREKLPDKVVIVDRLPKTPTHRIERAKLRDWLQKGQPAGFLD